MMRFQYLAKFVCIKFLLIEWRVVGSSPTASPFLSRLLTSGLGKRRLWFGPAEGGGRKTAAKAHGFYRG